MGLARICSHAGSALEGSEVYLVGSSATNAECAALVASCCRAKISFMRSSVDMRREGVGFLLPMLLVGPNSWYMALVDDREADESFALLLTVGSYPPRSISSSSSTEISR